MILKVKKIEKTGNLRKNDKFQKDILREKIIGDVLIEFYLYKKTVKNFLTYTIFPSIPYNQNSNLIFHQFFLNFVRNTFMYFDVLV